MALPKSLKWLFMGTAGLLGLILLLLAVISFFRIPINLEKHKELIEYIAAEAIDRKVTINGDLKVTTSLWPVFIIEDVQVRNPENLKDGDFARLRSARIEIGLVRLLLGKIRVKNFEVDGLELYLRVDERGDVNWVFNGTEPEPGEPKEKPEAKPRELTSDTIIVDRIHMSNISVSYFAPDMDSPKEFTVDTCNGTALPGEAFQFTLTGSTLKEPYEVSIRAASLQEFLEENRSWLDIEAQIAKAKIKFSGNVDLAAINHRLKLNLEIMGEGLENFNQLLNLDLPPVPSYGLTASLSLMKGVIDLTDLKFTVSDSELTGSIKVDKTKPVPEATLTLHSSQIQINDFDFDDWSPFHKSTEADEPAQDTAANGKKKIVPSAGKKEQTAKVLELLSPESLAELNASFSITADNVLSGEDQLGNGKIVVVLEDGRISLDPLELNIPGGSLLMSMSIKPGRESAEAAFQVQVQNFDFGVMARRADPETNMGGIINLDVALKSSANDFSDLLAQGNGYFDFSAKPENLQAGIMDLWALNVISAIVSNAVKGKSHIEYILGRWAMKNGYLEPEVFVIDTTRMRICGKGSVDFRQHKLNLEVAPTPKKPEFFSLATPISIQGDFKDFGLVISPGGLIGTGIKFAISPLQVPLQTIFDKPIPSDGSDLMTIELGPENRDMKRPIGCRWGSTGK